MIDPRALQQHFQKVHQKEKPPKQEVPRVPNPVPLTALQAIPIIEPEPVIIEQEEVMVPAPKLIKAEIPKIVIKPLKEKINLVVNVPPPINQLVINDIEELEEVKVVEKKKEKDNPYGYSGLKSSEDNYDPYGYYSGPQF